MSEKPSYEELEQKIRELESNAADLKNITTVLKEKEQMFRHSFENANIGSCLVEPDGNFIMVNNRMVEIFGYSKNEFKGMNVDDVSHPEDIVISKEVQRNVKDNIIGNAVFQKRYIHKNGRMFWGKVSSSIVKDHDGKPLYFVTHFTDITETKKTLDGFREHQKKLESLVNERTKALSQTNEALRESEKKFRQLIENINEIFWIRDVETNQLLYMSPNFEDIWGLSILQVTEKPETFLEAIHPDERDRFISIYKKQKDDEAFKFEYRIVKTDGSVRWINEKNFPVFDESGKVYRRAGINEDITDRKRAEEKIIVSEEKYKRLFYSINDGICLHEIICTAGEPIDYRILDVNPKYEELIGINRDEAIGAAASRLYKTDKAPYLDIYAKVVETGKPTSFETYFEPMDKHFIISVFSPGKNQFATIFQDITERKKYENKIQQAQRMEAIGTLAGGIAHDFNNILSAIIGFTELALDEVEKNTNLEDSLQEVYTAGKRAKDLVKQILTISRHDKTEVKPIQVAPLVKEALKMLRSTIPTSIEFRENICSAPLVINADPTQLHQIIVNLVTNAKQAMADESGILEIDVNTISFESDINNFYLDMQPGDYVRITVSDTGCGISDKFIKKIFEPYFTTKEKGEGTGLGLSVVHGIVKSHNGHITVYSELGKGTAFHVYLPLVSKASDGMSEKPVEPLPTGIEKILLVDDERPIVKMQAQHLERLGYTVTARTSSHEALEILQQSPEKFDLIITDMTMPNLTGDRLAEKIKAICKDIPIILCTGFSEKINVRGEIPGIDGVLMKPVDKLKIAKMVRKVLDEAKG
ncbi:PAS domain-containing hybrid sensor histidine kinase/response regulator [Desulfocicer niacini]